VRGCLKCELQLEQALRLRQALAALPQEQPPAELAASLRVIASRERARRIARNDVWSYYRDRFRLVVDNLMRPVALPFAGGLISAVLLFSMLMPGISIRRLPISNDVPVDWFTSPAVKAQTPFGFNEDEFVVEVQVDEQGRMVDYRIAQGPALTKDSEFRRAIENNLLFTEFVPATAFGRPTSGKMYLQFRRFGIHVTS